MLPPRAIRTIVNGNVVVTAYESNASRSLESFWQFQCVRLYCVASVLAGALDFRAPPSSEKGAGSTSSFAFKGTKTKNGEPAPQGQFETSQLELSLKSHAFEKFVYIYIYAFSRCFYPKRLTVLSCYTYFFQYMCSLGIEPTTFALLTQCSNHWTTGTLCT